MDFEQRLRNTMLRSPDQVLAEKDRLEEVRRDVGEVLRAVMRVFASATRHIPGAKVPRPGTDPAEPAFFVTGLQIPRQRANGHMLRVCSSSPVRCRRRFAPVKAPDFSSSAWSVWATWPAK